MMRKEKGFTLIELLIVVAIIGIIAAIAIPNLLSAIQRAKQKRAMGELRTVATAAQSYATDANIFPIQAAIGDMLAGTVNADLAPDYVKVIPNPDPWDSAYQYVSASGGTDFEVLSWGKDRANDGATVTAFPSGYFNNLLHTQCFQNDIVWADDGFVAIPEGKQKSC
jgi:general secretion pathway protein G